ncbi:MAG TPA: response regulator transcription factor [Nitrospira sp.]|nr:response regulator transcription factor [Nitrospira sp.]
MTIPMVATLTAPYLPRTLLLRHMAQHRGKKILIVEDERDILELVKLYLDKEGFRTVTATTGAEGLKCVKDEKPDLIVLDLMLPEIDGLEVCKRLRAAHETAMIPIIMLTAKAEESDQVIGLELGADDYVTKPFSPKALLARVKAMFRRLERSHQEAVSVYRYGELTMDLSRHEVSIRGKEIPLTAKEFGLLEHLLRNPGRVLTRDVLLNTVWGYDYFGTTRTVDVHVRRLKQKIPLLEEAIHSIKSLGYKLKEP